MSVKLGDAVVYLASENAQLKKDLEQARGFTQSWTKRLADGIYMALGNVLVNTVGRGIQKVQQLAGEVTTFADQSHRAVGIFKTQLGATTEEALQLRDVAKEVFRQNFGEDLLDAVNTVGLVRQQLRQLSTEQLNQVSQFALALRDTYQSEVPKSIDAVNTLMSTMGMTHKQAMDFITAGYQRGLDRSGDFLDSITEYAPQFQSMGASAGQFFSLMETGLQGGILGTDKISDLFKEFNNRILDGSSTTAEGLAKIGLSAQGITEQVNKGETTLADTFQLVIDRLAMIDDEATRRQAGVALLGTQFEDLGMGTAVAFDLAKTKLNELAGASDALGARYNNIGDMTQALGRRLVVALEPAVSIFMELANEAMPSVEGMFTRIEAVASQFATGFVGAVKGISATLRAFFGGIRQNSDQSLGGVAESAGGWGKAIVLQLAKGMATAATAVIRVLQQLGSIIAHWLKPNSPPKILPNIDKWGKAAAEVWLGGFTTANTGILKKLGQGVQKTLKGFTSVGDVKLFDAITSKIGQLFRSLPGAGEDVGIINRIMGSRTAVAQAIRELQETGQVGKATYDLLARAMSPLPQIAQEYVRSLLEMSQADKAVAEAQERLNNLTQEYSDKLSPLHKELDAIRDKRQVTANEERIAELRKELASGSLSAEEAELAMMEIREKELQNQITAIENERDVAIEAAEDELSAAEEKKKAIQEQVALQESLLQAQEQNNQLVQEQMNLLDSLASALGGVASGLADAVGGGGLGSALSEAIGDMPTPDGLVDGLEETLEDALSNFDVDGLMGEVEGLFAPVTEEAQKLGETFGTVIERLEPLSGWFSDSSKMAKRLENGLKTLLIIFVSKKIALWVGGLAAAFSAAVANGGLLAGIVTALGGPITILTGLVTALALAWSTDFMGMQTVLKQVFAILLYYVLEAGNNFKMLIAIITGVFILAGQSAQQLVVIMAYALNQASVSAQKIVGVILGFFLLLGQKAKEGFQTVVTSIAETGIQIIETLNGWYLSMQNWFNLAGWKALGQYVITQIHEKLAQFWETVSLTVQGWYDSFLIWFNLAGWLALAEYVLLKLNEGFQTFWAVVSTTIQGWYASLKNWFNLAGWKALAQFVITQLMAKLATFWEQAKATFDGWYTAIKDWWEEQDWLALASNVIDGIVAGIQAGVGSVMDAVSGLVDKAKDAWDEAWDSNSPSKLMKKSARDDVVGGAALGAEEGGDRLNKAMRKVASDAFDDFAGQGQTAVPSATPLTSAPIIQQITFTGDLNFKDKAMVDYFMAYLQSLTEQATLQPFTGSVS